MSPQLLRVWRQEEPRVADAALHFNPSRRFFDSSIVHADRPAMTDGEEALTYMQARHRVAALAAELAPIARRGAKVALLASRSVGACLGVLAAAWNGAAFAPISLKLPKDRLIALLAEYEFDALVYDKSGEALLDEDLRAVAPALCLAANRAGPGETLRSWLPPADMAPSDLAYVEFTSGTTGTPKGVMISAGGLEHYISVMEQWYDLGSGDRVAETADLSFDIAVSNMFMTWNAGAALYIASNAVSMAPVKFIREHQLTMWYSVPSAITVAERTRTLKPGCMPSLRYSTFAGDALPVAGARAWAAAAPNSRIDNLYGPTEATVVCLRQEVTEPIVATEERGIVAIGNPYPGMQAAILGPGHAFLPPGQRGEIALSGPQVALGYWNRAALTEERFPTIDGRRWYLTGDLGYRDAAGCLHHLGRLDNQVKVRGYRVELEEIELFLRLAAETSTVAVAAWPCDDASALGLVAFVAESNVSAAEIDRRLRATLPHYMMPNPIVTVEALTLNANGKVDRKAMIAALEASRAARGTESAAPFKRLKVV